MSSRSPEFLLGIPENPSYFFLRRETISNRKNRLLLDGFYVACDNKNKRGSSLIYVVHCRKHFVSGFPPSVKYPQGYFLEGRGANGGIISREIIAVFFRVAPGWRRTIHIIRLILTSS